MFNIPFDPGGTRIPVIGTKEIIGQVCSDASLKWLLCQSLQK